MYGETGDMYSAIRELKIAVSLDQNKEQSHLALGSLYAKNNQDTEAIS